MIVKKARSNESRLTRARPQYGTGEFALRWSLFLSCPTLKPEIWPSRADLLGLLTSCKQPFKLCAKPLARALPEESVRTLVETHVLIGERGYRLTRTRASLQVPSDRRWISG